MFHYFTRIELVGVRLRRKNDRRFKRAKAACGAMGCEMQKGKFLRLAGEKAGGGGVSACKLDSFFRAKIVFEKCNFLSGQRQRRKVGAGGQRVSDEQQTCISRRRCERAAR